MESASIGKHYGRPESKGIKLHLGSGDYWFDGFINVDLNIYAGTDMVWDIRKPMPFVPEVVERIEAYEVLEHLSELEVEGVLMEWMRLLMPGGQVKISVPDMDGLVKMYETNKEEAIRMIYGFVDHPHHKWGYTKESLEKLFKDNGFKDVSIIQGSLPERSTEPQLILECHK